MQPVRSHFSGKGGAKGGKDKGGKGHKGGDGDKGGAKGGTDKGGKDKGGKNKGGKGGDDGKGGTGGKGVCVGLLLSVSDVNNTSTHLDLIEDAALSLYATASPHVHRHDDDDVDAAASDRQEMVTQLGVVLVRTNMVRRALDLPER